jgi:diguanylate cyclase (GGDEF)-like protein
MKDQRFYTFLHKQIPIMIGLSLFPGLGYIFLGWLHGIHTPALIWYGLVVATSAWGYRLYRGFHYEQMSPSQIARWYQHLSIFFYLFFLLWTLIFLIYVLEQEYKLHYVAIFTQIGSSVVASALLSSDRRLYAPTITILMVPLILYFFNIGEWYGYVLTLFGCVFTWVLFYAASSSRDLLQQSQFQASHDMLTGLHNRHYFIDSLQQSMNSLRESNGYSYLLLIDLDHFKNINDSLGHDIGDTLLKEVSSRLRQRVPVDNELARLGGDEFIIVGSEHPDRESCEAMAIALSEDLLFSLKQNYVIERHHLYISCSIGVSLISAESSHANRFIKEADIAMYEVKAKGRDGIFLFNEEMAARVEKNLEIERLLHFALQNDEISLHFQPQLDAAGAVIGAESLVRWHSQKLGPVSPVEFIPIAEQTGLIIELGNYILERAFTTLRQWHDQGLQLEQFSVNISMRQFMHQGFIAEVRRLSALHLSHELLQHLVFEVTESLVAEDINKIIAIMEELRTLGIRFSMDDFGTGYSSLSYLKQLPIDEIKIDRAFVSKLDQDEEDQAMITTILKMAQIFGLSIVAEGVETEGQWKYLRERGCDYFQGYLFARPLPAEQFEQFYLENHKLTTD